MAATHKGKGGHKAPLSPKGGSQKEEGIFMYNWQRVHTIPALLAGQGNVG